MEAKIKVSVIDDHPLYRKGIKSMLEECPRFEFLSEAGNGKEFLELLQKDIPDVILLDYEMPEMNGLETTAYLKKNFPQLKILILTMHDSEELAKLLVANGAHGFLIKESDIEPLVEAIDSVMRVGYYFNEYISQKIRADLIKGGLIHPKFNPSNLSIREQQVVSLLCLDYSSKEIAEILGVGLRTVDTYRKTAIEKVDAVGMGGLILYGYKNKLDKKFKYSRNVRRRK